MKSSETSIGKADKFQKNILVIDDNPDDLHLLTGILSKNGYKTRAATSALLALNSARSSLPDLILLDIKMTDMNGYEVCRHLKADEQTRDIPVVFVSALDEIVDKVKAFDMGGVDYIAKPFEEKEILARIGTHLSLREIQKRLVSQKAQLHQEVMERKFAEEALQKVNVELEQRVKERTEELVAANDALKQEIQERKKAEEARSNLEARLQQVQKMEALGTLAGGIAHDFNNILTPIMMQSEIALMDVSHNDPLSFKLQQIFKAANRAKNLVKQILTFSRQAEQQKIPLQVIPILKEALKLLRSSLPTTIEIQEALKVESDTVLADPTQIHQILMNLCSNAGYAMRKKGGVLGVYLEKTHLDADAASQHYGLKSGQYLKLTVSDTGHGMEKPLLHRIFEPFFTTKGPGEGTGMGLSAVHGIVRGLGGAIAVDSEVGKGTVFHVFLPRIERAVCEEEGYRGPLPRGNERILLVDDEKMIVDLLQDLLDNLGYEVISRTSSLEALEVFRAKPDAFELVITDQTMPNLTGKELALEVKKIRPDISILLCTGFSEQISEKEANNIGITGYVMKPVAIGELAKMVRKALDQESLNPKGPGIE